MNYRFLSLLIIILNINITGYGQDAWKFQFGKETNALGTNLITEPISFGENSEFGFDFENKDKVQIKSTEKKLSGYFTSEFPVYFSLKIPEGSYLVKIKIGNHKKASTTTIKAEARRLMIHNLELKKGEMKELSFTVNVRSPKINEERSIRLKSRELNYMNWDNRLSLEFSGKNFAVHEIEITPAKNITTLFLAGNSTVTDQDHEPWASWGQMITPYFNASLSVANYAESGESLASFKSAGRLDKVLTMMKPGDYLFIEFGHNDQKRKGEGIGPWTSFTDLLTEFVTRTREKGGIPVLITPTQRRSFDDDGQIVLTHGDYPDDMRALSENMKVPLIDLNKMTKIMYEAWGPGLSKKAFVHYPAGTFPGQEKELKDNTHFNTFGAHEVALCVLKGIIDQNIPAESFIINYNANYNPSNPSNFDNWKLEMSPRFVSKKPDGN